MEAADANDESFDRPIISEGSRYDFEPFLAEYDHVKQFLVSKFHLAPEDIEDVTQQAYFQVIKYLHTFKGECKPFTWICRIAYNEGIKFLRKRDRSGVNWHFPRNEEVIIRGPFPAQGPDVNLLREEVAAMVLGFLSQLPANYAAVVRMADMEGMPNEEIADTLHVSVSTLKSRLHRARKHLREKMQKSFLLTH